MISNNRLLENFSFYNTNNHIKQSYGVCDYWYQPMILWLLGNGYYANSIHLIFEIKKSI